VLRQEIRKLTEKIVVEEKFPLNYAEREKLFKEIQDEVMGLGPLEPFMEDPTFRISLSILIARSTWNDSGNSNGQKPGSRMTPISVRYREDCFSRGPPD